MQVNVALLKQDVAIAKQILLSLQNRAELYDKHVHAPSSSAERAAMLNEILDNLTDAVVQLTEELAIVSSQPTQAPPMPGPLPDEPRDYDSKPSELDTLISQLPVGTTHFRVVARKLELWSVTEEGLRLFSECGWVVQTNTTIQMQHLLSLSDLTMRVLELMKYAKQDNIPDVAWDIIRDIINFKYYETLTIYRPKNTTGSLVFSKQFTDPRINIESELNVNSKNIMLSIVLREVSTWIVIQQINIEYPYDNYAIALENLVTQPEIQNRAINRKALKQ